MIFDSQTVDKIVKKASKASNEDFSIKTNKKRKHSFKDKSSLSKDREYLVAPLIFEKVRSAFPHLKGLDLLEELLEHFQVTFQTSWKDKERIPAEGRVVIVANHPLGTLDAVALLKLVSEVRSDVRILIEDDSIFPADSVSSDLSQLSLPFVSGAECLQDSEESPNRHVFEFLSGEGAVIIFPSRDISRIRPKGLRDPKWRGDFLSLALAAQAPVLPIFIDASNSALFYGISVISKPLSSLLLMPEIHKQARKAMTIRIGETIPHKIFSQSDLPPKAQVKLFKNHIYEIGKGKPGLWPSERAIAHPEPKKQLREMIVQHALLGATTDDKQIFLYRTTSSCSVLREIGRLRELAFRAVGEGSGGRRDIDQFDAYYSQLVLWDEQSLDIVGAYRIGHTAEILHDKGLDGLYSATLFDYSEHMLPILKQGVELGRSFVQPKYWGKRSLDYLWYGIGAFLQKHPHIRYLYGPVSLSNDLPNTAKDLLVYFFSLYFGQAVHEQQFLANSGMSLEALPKQRLARSKSPYRLSSELVEQLKSNFTGEDYKQDFKTLKHILSNMGCQIPTLYKQYSDLCEPGGMIFLDFGIDDSFGQCIDGLVVVDVTKLKPKKRERYIPAIHKQENRNSLLLLQPSKKHFRLVAEQEED